MNIVAQAVNKGGGRVNIVVGTDHDIWIEVIPHTGEAEKIPIFSGSRQEAVQMLCWKVGIKDFTMTDVGQDNDTMAVIDNKNDQIMVIEFFGKSIAQFTPMNEPDRDMDIQLLDLDGDTYSEDMGHVLQIQTIKGEFADGRISGKSFTELAGRLTDNWKIVNFEGGVVRARCLRVSTLVKLWDSVTAAMGKEKVR